MNPWMQISPPKINLVKLNSNIDIDFTTKLEFRALRLITIQISPPNQHLTLS